MSLTVVVADDDDVVRASLRAVFAEDDRFRLVGEATRADETVALVAAERPDVVVLDLRMPGGGVEAARGIQRLGLTTTVVAVSARIDPSAVTAMLRAGARGMFLKGRVGDLGDLVVRCRAGEVILAVPPAEGLRCPADGAH